MYTPPWIPRADAAFRSFAESFAKNIHADPARYGLVPAQAQSILDQYHLFNAAYMIAINPATHTRGTIIDKDDARSILRHTIRSYAADIRANQGVDDGDKIGIGVRPRNVSHKKRRCPTIPPLLNYMGSLPGMDELRYHDSSAPTSKAKPSGTERLELWVAYSKPGEPKPRREDAQLVGSFKKSKMIVEQDPQCDVRMGGSEGTPTYWARWVGYDGEAGPWSLPCFTTIKAKPAETATPAGDAHETNADEAGGDEAMKQAA